MKHNRINTDFESYKGNHARSYEKSYGREDYEEEDLKYENQQKISNIERINGKIRKILETLNE